MSESAPRSGDAAPLPLNTDRRAASEGLAAENATGPLKPDDDADIVRLARTGDRDAFRQLFDKYHRRVFAIALSVVKQPADATDITQETFVKVFKNIAGFEGESRFYTWLYRIAKNLSLDHLRSRNKVRQLDFDDSIGRKFDDVADAGIASNTYLGGDPGQLTTRKELRANLERALATLGPLHRQAIILCEIDGLPYDEIAKMLDIPTGTVMSRVFYARRKLRAALSEYVNAESSPPPESEGDDDATR